MKQFTVAIVGLGGRGLHTYAKYQDLFPDRMKIVAIADIDGEKVRYAGEKYSVPARFRFDSAESLLAREKLADVLIIATQDTQHYLHALKALERGYDILLEKPVSVTAKQCVELRDAAKRAGRMVAVCHVLQYTAFYRKIKEIIKSGAIGEPVTVAAIENVGYWHQAHSFVRGNWRNDAIESPMILQKCCHDFDILCWLLDRRCLSVSSIGSLKYFRAENAPEGSAERCVDCKLSASCPYSALRIYLDGEEIGLRKGNRGWPCDIVAEDPTEERLIEALRKGPYGRCVFRCDNNVVDHQIVDMQMEDEITVSLTMTAFTAYNCRQLKVMGTLGEIVADQRKNLVTVTPFGGESVEYDITKLTDDLSGHGGGDNRMMTEMFDALERGGDVSSAIDGAISSHLIAFAAENSRKRGGERLDMAEFEKQLLCPAGEGDRRTL